MRLAAMLMTATLVLIGPGAGLSLAQDDPGSAGEPAATLTVAEIGVGTGWDNQTRALLGADTSFAAGTERLYCRTLITGAEPPSTVTPVWDHEGRTMARVELTVGSSHWRTVSSKGLLPEWTGAWEVKVLDPAGTVLESVQFTVE